ncbi:MAG: efflux RND transporter periplasmic adaptor subunit [Polyangiales bacterium]
MSHDAHSDEAFDPAPHRPSRAALALAALAAVAALGGLVALGVVPRARAARELRRDEAQGQGVVPTVSVARATRGEPSAEGLSLPGSIEPVQDAMVYPRLTGYLRERRVDLGDRVTAGQVLATIDSPEVAQELRQALAAAGQARANLQQQRANLALARAEAQRYGALVGSGVVSRQEDAQRRAQAEAGEAAVAAAQAALASAEANASRLREVLGFATVRAPFAGVVTARNAESGQLVTAGSTSAPPLFRVSKTDVVRVMVSVPQAYAPSVRVGARATLRLREFPSRAFEGEVSRTAGALDAATRTLLTEVRVPNADGALLAGMYTKLSLRVGRAAPPLLVPATALSNNADGTRVAVVVGDVVRWRPVRVDADLGDRVAVASGLAEGDAVVVSAGDWLREGTRVHPVAAPPRRPR